MRAFFGLFLLGEGRFGGSFTRGYEVLGYFSPRVVDLGTVFLGEERFWAVFCPGPVDLGVIFLIEGRFGGSFSR